MLTDIFPDSILYDAIEEAYNNSDYASKEGFCHDYKFNVGGLAQRIQEAAERERWRAEERHRNAMTDNAKIIQELTERLKNADFGTETMSKREIAKYALKSVNEKLISMCDHVKRYGARAEYINEIVRLSKCIQELQAEIDKKEV